MCEKVKGTLGNGESYACVDFVCNWGKHRSVACAHLFGMIVNELCPRAKVVVNHKSLKQCKCKDCNQVGRVLPKSILNIFEHACDL